MTHISLLKKITLAGMAALTVWMFAAAAFPAKSYAATGLCYDAMAGVAYKCPSDPGTVKIEGKSDKQFDKNKCYAFSDPAKGWQVADCKAAVFEKPQNIAPIQKSEDKASNQNYCPEALKTKNGDNCDIVARYLNPLITFLTVAVGLVVAISIVIGGIQYATARDNPQAISEAKKRIAGAIIGFIGYSLLWAFLQWIVPGGMLNG